MRLTFSSQKSLIVLVPLLIFLLAACERPLNEVEEATAAPLPTLITTPELGPEEIAPTLVPTQAIETPVEATTEAGAQPTAESGDATGGTTEEGQGDQTDATQPPPEPRATTLPTGEQVHIVQAGENLFRISLRYGCTVAEVAAYNGIVNPDYISVGQEIRIPANCGGG